MIQDARPFNPLEDVDKTCVLCGRDTRDRSRMRDKRGRYYCTACHERARQRCSSPPPRDDDQPLVPLAGTERAGGRRASDSGRRRASSAGAAADAASTAALGVRPRGAPIVARTVGNATKWDRILEQERERQRRASRCDVIVPAVMLVAALAILFGIAAGAEGALPFSTVASATAIVLGAEVLFGLAGLYAASKLWLGGAGSLPLAALRLAAIFAVLAVVAIPLAAGSIWTFLALLGIYACLMAWQFELDAQDACMVAALTFSMKLLGSWIAIMLIL